MTAAQILGYNQTGTQGNRTVAQIEAAIRADTERCMDEKKSDGFLNQIGANREDFRGRCEGYALNGALGRELRAAQEREAAIKNTFDAAAARAASQQSSNTTLYVVMGIALLTILLIPFSAR